MTPQSSLAQALAPSTPAAAMAANAAADAAHELEERGDFVAAAAARDSVTSRAHAAAHFFRTVRSLPLLPSPCSPPPSLLFPSSPVSIQQLVLDNFLTGFALLRSV